MRAPIAFACPRCKQTFEFDIVGEYELVPCPICGTEFMTVWKGQKLLLQGFEFEHENQKLHSATHLVVELPC
jgi:Zn finger protein HypA/HybF involved in hydrogenase expression